MCWSATSTATLSVISSTSRLPGNPVRARARRTSSTRSGFSSWRPERLTCSSRSIGVAPSLRHAAACAVATSSTWRPIWPMAPVSSAISMNAAGSSTPRPGWSQRTRASRATIRPVTRSTIGW